MSKPPKCWQCGTALAKVNGTGDFYGKPAEYYFVLVKDPLGHEHKVHKVCANRTQQQFKPFTASTSPDIPPQGKRTEPKYK